MMNIGEFKNNGSSFVKIPRQMITVIKLILEELDEKNL